MFSETDFSCTNYRQFRTLNLKGTAQKKNQFWLEKPHGFYVSSYFFWQFFALFGYNMDGLRHVPPIRTGMGAVESVTKTSFNLNPMSAERRSRLTRLTHLFFPVATQPRNRLGAALLMGRSCYFCFKNGLIKLNMKYLIGYSVYHARSDNNILGMNL